jgi:cell division protein FtsI (penicillin-binding protein 3)
MHWGGALCGPVFKEVMSFVLQSQGIAPTQEKVKKVALNEAQLNAQKKVLRAQAN